MNNIIAILSGFLGVGFITALSFHSNNIKADESNKVTKPRYLRVSIAHWNVSTYSSDAEKIFQLINTDGLAVFKAQPGFIDYRLMRADSNITIAAAEWESEELGLAGAESYREWMRSVGIMNYINLETYAGEIVVGKSNN